MIESPVGVALRGWQERRPRAFGRFTPPATARLTFWRNRLRTSDTTAECYRATVPHSFRFSASRSLRLKIWPVPSTRRAEVSRRQPRASVALTQTLVKSGFTRVRARLLAAIAERRDVRGIQAMSILPHDAGAFLIRGRAELPVAGLDSITLEWLRSGSRSHEGRSNREIWPVL
jgi:hypothetical protein